MILDVNPYAFVGALVGALWFAFERGRSFQMDRMAHELDCIEQMWAKIEKREAELKEAKP